MTMSTTMMVVKRHYGDDDGSYNNDDDDDDNNNNNESSSSTRRISCYTQTTTRIPGTADLSVLKLHLSVTDLLATIPGRQTQRP